MNPQYDVLDIRRQFSGLSRLRHERPVIFFDGPAGSQVPQRVADSVSHYLLHTNANHGALFETAVESDALLDEARRTLADFLGTPDPDCISFGANMTTIALHVSRALGRTWSSGDEIIVSRLDHDANFAPWILAAQDAGATVHYIDVNKADCTLDMNSFREQLSDKTRLVAVGYASNATGSINPIADIVRQAHAVGSLVFVDAVHYAPHSRINVAEVDCDFLACSAYKFFGPHVGVLYGRRQLLESLTPYKLRPAPNTLPGRWMTGTQNHEGIAGAAAAVEYLADLGRSVDPAATDRRSALDAAFSAIVEYEQSLVEHLLFGLKKISSVRILGIAERARLSERVPTVSIVSDKASPEVVAAALAEQGIFVWSGNHYALPFTETMDLEPEGTLRIGLMHYNTVEEVDRLLAAIADIV
jgi:cysteine desulfurase family protein (TIGR01976 family)